MPVHRDRWSTALPLSESSIRFEDALETLRRKDAKKALERLFGVSSHLRGSDVVQVCLRADRIRLGQNPPNPFIRTNLDIGTWAVR